MKVILALLFVAALLFAGCTGGAQTQAQASANGNGAAASGQANANAQADGGTAPPAAPEGQQTPPQAPPAPEPQAQASAADAFLSAMGMAKGWKVTYDVTSSITPGVTTVTIYSKWSGSDNYKARTDASAQGMMVRSYVLGKSEMYSCFNQGSWSCMKLSSTSDDSSAQKVADEVKSNPGKYTITADGTMAIAGTAANCYKVVSTDYTARYCISPEGVPLYVWYKETSGGQTVETETKATSYSTAVTDADFTLPAQPSSTPSGGNSALPMDCDVTCNGLSGQALEQCMLYCQANA